MIDLKSEILAKRQKEDKKVDLYNSVIKEYIPQIKDIFEYSNLKVDYQKSEGLIKITIISEDEKTKYNFSYVDVKRYLYINSSDDLADKGMIESTLKDFVLKVAGKENIRIKEGLGKYKIGTKVKLIKDLIDEYSEETIKKGLEGKISSINYASQEIRVDLEGAVVSINDKGSIEEKFKIIE